jgi:hypothetical protein
VIEQWFRDYKNILEKYKIDPRFIWNTDETQARTLPDKHKVAHLEKSEKASREGVPMDEHKTVVLWISAVGHSFPPAVIFPLVTLPHLCPEVQSFFNILGTGNGWITGPTLKTLIEEGFIKHLKKYRAEQACHDEWALLILDNHSSRFALWNAEQFAEHKLILLFIPPHSSALLQPLDLGPNLALKHVYSKRYKHHPEDDTLQCRNRKMEAIRMGVSHATTIYTIVTGWERTGLWPVNPEVPLRSTMVEVQHTPVVRTPKMKRGPKFGVDGMMTTTGVMVSASDPNKENIAPKQKKQRIKPQVTK